MKLADYKHVSKVERITAVDLRLTHDEENYEDYELVFRDNGVGLCCKHSFSGPHYERLIKIWSYDDLLKLLLENAKEV